MESEEEVPFPAAAEERGWRGAVRRRLPVLRWARTYDRTAAVADAVAGVTLGLTLVPQSIAYASLANLPVHYGLYSAFVGTMLYVALGTVKEVSIGPTSLMALLTLHTCRDLPVDCVVLLTFLAGCLVLLMGLLRLGFLVELISPSVTNGFTSATAVIIMVAQLKGLLGLSFVAESPFDNIRLVVQRWRLVRLPDCALAAGCCAVLLALRKLKDIPVGAKRRRLAKLLWLVSIARNALVVLGASAAAYCTHDAARPLFQLSGKVEPGLPKFGLPPFSAVVGNQTLGFFEIVERLGSGLAVLPLVMVLANIAIAKAFTVGGRVDATQEMLTLGVCNIVGSLVRAMPTCGAFTRSAVSHSSGVRTPAAGLYSAVGGRVDATQEMLTLGVCNIVGSLVRAMPTCGAFTRSAVSHSSGVRTPAAGLYSGIITLLALNYLTQYFFFIPKACLSSVLICAVVFMIDVSGVIALWRSDRREACVALLTFTAGVTLGVEAAVLGGALASLAVLLRELLRPPRLLLAKDKASGERVVLVRPRRALVYANAERAAAAVRAALASRAAPCRAVLLDCGTLALLDHTAVQVLNRLVEELEGQGRRLVLYNASPEALPLLRRVVRHDARALAARDMQSALTLAAEPPPPRDPAPAPLAPPTPRETLPLLDRSRPAHEEV